MRLSNTRNHVVTADSKKYWTQELRHLTMQQHLSQSVFFSTIKVVASTQAACVTACVTRIAWRAKRTLSTQRNALWELTRWCKIENKSLTPNSWSNPSFIRHLSSHFIQVIWFCLLSQSAPEKHSQGKTHKPLRTSKKCLPCLIIVLSYYFGYGQIFRMFSLHDMRFLLCSFHLDLLLRAQRIIGFFILITHKSMRPIVR